VCQITTEQLKRDQPRAHCPRCPVCVLIDYDPDEFHGEDYPPYDWTEYQLSFEMKKLAFLITHESQNVRRFDMDGTAFTVKLGKAVREAEESVRHIDLEGSLQNLEVRDMRTKGTDPGNADDLRLSFSDRASVSGARDSFESDSNDGSVILRRTNEDSEKLVKVAFKRNKQFDVSLNLRLQPVSVDVDLYRLFDFMSVVNEMIGVVTDDPQKAKRATMHMTTRVMIQSK
jgi:hypothetical protein